MVTLSNHSDNFEEGQNPARKRICSWPLVFIGLGAMVLTVLCLLPGCGSDSTPEGSVKGKNAKAATGSKVTKMQAAIPLLTDKEGTVPGKSIKLKPPEAQRIEVFPGITQAELEAKKAADRAKFDPRNMEVFPGAGISQEQLEAKKAADRAKFDPRSMEVFPGAGITQEQLEAKKAAERAKLDPKLRLEKFPRETQ